MHWDTLFTRPAALVRRGGRFVVADLLTPHLVLSTSAVTGGQSTAVRHLVNHQSCEGSGHGARAHLMVELGQDGYHRRICGEINLDPDAAATMGTAANMQYAAIVSAADDGLEATAIVTAGVQTNAVCAGDPAHWRETADGVVKATTVTGTINTMLLINTPVAAPALARVVVTMTEGKSAALQRLAVPSCYSPDLATGTGTDQFCVAAPLGPGKPLTSASPHMKLGELVGRATRDATLEALRWQNGLEPSYTRGLFHALGRYGVTEATVFDALAPLLDAGDLELLRRNSKAAFYEPLVGAAAHALAAVLDRRRHGTLPESAAAGAVVHEAATLAASLAAQPHRWPEFRQQLHAIDAAEPRHLVLAAIALGWREKWRSS